MNQPQTVGDVFRMMDALPADYERKRKACMIEDIFKIEKLLNYPARDGRGFDELYDKEYGQLYDYYVKLQAECAAKYIDSQSNK